MKKTAKGIAAVVATAALTALGTVSPALAEAAPAASHPARVVAAHRVASADAIASAVAASGLAWSGVEGAQWRLDEARGAYVVTLVSTEGAEATVFVDALTGAARMAVSSADAIASAVAASGLAWAGVEGAEWHADESGNYVVTLYTTRGSELAAVVDAYTGAVRAM